MRPLRAAVPTFVLSCLAALALAACGSSKGSGVNGGGNATAGSNGSGATNGVGTAGSLNIGANPGTGAGNGVGDGGAGSIDACAGETIQAERIPLDMYVMLDISGSMTYPTVGNPDITKWQAVSSALVDFVGDQANDGLGVGLQLFPAKHPDAPASCTKNADCGTHFGFCWQKICWGYQDGMLPCDKASDCGVFGPCETFGSCQNDAKITCGPVGFSCGNDDVTNQPLGPCVAPAVTKCTMTDDCRAATYAEPAAPIATLPGAAPGLVTVIEGAMPEDGLTPTGPALTGALQQAGAWAKAHTDHQVVAVLATDGVPTLKAAGQYCASINADADINAVINVATSGRRSVPSISTFVIGVQSPDDVAAGAPDILNAIAQAGGTTQAFIVNTQGNVQTEFRAALNKIRAASLSCDLAIPAPAAGKTLDYGLVNVQFDDGTGPQTLGNVASEADCGTGKRWYYDVDPKAGTPTRILTCPAACDAFQKTDMGSVKIVLGCETEVVVK